MHGTNESVRRCGIISAAAAAPVTTVIVLQAVILRKMVGHEHGEQRFGVAEQTAEWDARYSERDGAMWSGRPNGRLVAEAGALTPGRVLDVGCGEGADAIWLAQRKFAASFGALLGSAGSPARPRCSAPWCRGRLVLAVGQFELVTVGVEGRRGVQRH